MNLEVVIILYWLCRRVERLLHKSKYNLSTTSLMKSYYKSDEILLQVYYKSDEVVINLYYKVN